MDVVEIEFQPGGLGLVFDDGISANGNLEVIAGSLLFTGLTAAQRTALQTFNSSIDTSIRNYDPRFGGGSGIGLNAIIEDDQSPHPMLGGFLDLNGFRIYNGADSTNPVEVRIPGTQAFDFQAKSTNLTLVASGDNSFAAGASNIASGVASSAHGIGVVASGDFSHAEGESTLASGIASHAEGFAAQATGRSSHSEGDLSKAIGDYSHAEGERTEASGEASHAQGSRTVASGDYSHAGGLYTTASGYASVAIGHASVASLYAQRAQASGYISQLGDAQRTEAIARITTVDQLWNEVFLDGDGGSHRFSIDESKFYAITITVMGYRQGAGLGAMMVRMVTIDNAGGVVTLHSEEVVGTDIDPGSGTGGATGGYYQLRLSASDPTEPPHLKIEVKHDDGIAPATIRWLVKIESVEVLSPILTSVSPSISSSPSISTSPSPSISISPSPSISEFSASISMSPSPSPSISISPSPSISTSPSPSISTSSSPSISISPSPSISEFSASISMSPSPSISTSPSPSISISPSISTSPPA